MVHHEQGLFLTSPRLAIDVTRRQPLAFVSHAHADHIARHELAFCTPETAALYRLRLGEGRRVKEIPCGQSIEYRGVKLTTLPAGHCLGSAMLHVEDHGKTMLYTGDFKLDASLTAQRAVPRTADLLVIESTFGNPRFRLPPREDVIGRLVDLVHRILQSGRTPVVHAYALGKAQELTALLTQHGIPVLQHPKIYAITRAYVECGVRIDSDTASVGQHQGGALEGHAVVTLPQSMPGYRLAGLGEVETIAVTGWAMDPGTKHRQRVDHALPLSDHADFDQLVEMVRLVNPQCVLTTHGPPGFDGHLRDLGFNARPLVAERQGQLF